jgi:two-component system LytT family response regulator
LELLLIRQPTETGLLPTDQKSSKLITMIRLRTSKGIQVINAEDIVRVEALSSYCKVYFCNGYPLTVAKVLHWFEANLPGDFFYRIHRGHIVNKSFISEISNDCKVKLVNGESLQVSPTKKNVLTDLKAF